VASVADQQGVQCDHVIQDGGSTDGTKAYLQGESRVRSFVEQDSGMYDAFNRGWDRSEGDFVAHLNADEQLLPGALTAIRACFEAHPEVDVVISGTLICDGDGNLLCYRRPIRPPLSLLLTSYHPTLTCSIFLRRSAFRMRPFLYDPSFRHISDALFMIDILRSQIPIVLLDRFTSVFTWTGENIGLSGSAKLRKEYAYQHSLAPGSLRFARNFIRYGFWLRKLMAGHYSRRHLEYSIYTRKSPQARKQFETYSARGIYRPAATKPKDERN
jgi:glycosyltransferase involved in cell wall biosynthesis